MAKNEVAKKEEAGALAIIDFAADAGQGFEGADASSYAIPFLRILQAISPQAKKKDPRYIDGAEEGDFFNTVTEKIYKGDDGVIVVPVYYAHKYNEWAPDRGGFRGSLSASEYAVLDKEIRKDSKGNAYEANVATGNAITDTREHYVIIVNNDNTWEPALIALSGSELKKSKKWMTLMQGFRIQGQIAPMFSQMYRLTPQQESNDKGSWAGMKIEHIGPVNSLEIYNGAKQFLSMVKSGNVKSTPADTDDLPY